MHLTTRTRDRETPGVTVAPESDNVVVYWPGASVSLTMTSGEARELVRVLTAALTTSDRSESAGAR